MSLPRYAEYKDSGVEWLGEVPAHWTTPPLYLRYQVELGKMLDAAKMSGKNLLPYLRNVDVQWNRINFDELPSIDITEGELERYTVREGDLLVCEGGEVGRAAIVPPINEVIGFQKALHRLRSLSKDEHPGFMYYTLAAAASRGVFSTGGLSTIAHLTGEQLRKYRFAKPSLAEQIAVATFLDRETAKIDALVAEQGKLLTLLAEKLQATISHVVTKGLDPETPMKDSGVEWLGEVPSHWEVSTLRRVIQAIESGVSVNATDSPAGFGEIGVLKTSCVYRGEFDPDENKVVVPEELERVACPVTAGTLIVSRMNTPDLVGAAGLVRCGAANLFLPDRLWQVHFKDINAAFIHYWTREPSYRAQVQSACAGSSSSMQNLSQDEFRNFALPIPTVAEQTAIVAFLDRETSRLDALTAEATRAIDLLRERRTALISAAVTGKIDVRHLASPEPA